MPGDFYRARLADNLGFVEMALIDALEFRGNGDIAASARLESAMKYAMFSGGRRLRPNFTIESWRFFNPVGAGRGGAYRPTEVKLLSYVVSAIELSHHFSLTHDDLPAMDDDDKRRGRDSLHRAYDEATALLAGDALLTLAFWRAAAASPEAVSELGYGVMRMIRGQAMDMDGADGADGADGVSGADGWRDMAIRKTGALFGTACVLGGLVSGANSRQVAALRKYGENAGVAYQVLDDLNDMRDGDGDGASNIVKSLGVIEADKILRKCCGDARNSLAMLENATEDAGDEGVARAATLSARRRLRPPTGGVRKRNIPVHAPPPPDGTPPVTSRGAGERHPRMPVGGPKKTGLTRFADAEPLSFHRDFMNYVHKSAHKRLLGFGINLLR
ncbi:MAG: polyprenyl synthetase family protein [Alphaproteobacteria bacterium]|nr:polyprenyl synthetase family protein [Alphaproteobacteria bacterium]